MKFWKRNLLESYFWGLLTGTSVTGLILLIYLRAVFQIQIIGPAHEDYGWVTFILGTKNPDGHWYSNMVGYTTTFIVLTIFVIFFCILLSILTLKKNEPPKINQSEN